MSVEVQIDHLAGSWAGMEREGLGERKGCGGGVRSGVRSDLSPFGLVLATEEGSA